MSALLREAYIVGRELKDREFVEWVECELNGYDLGEPVPGTLPPGFPEYRRPAAELKAEAAYGITKPIQLPDEKLEDILCRPPLHHPAAELEAWLDVFRRGQRMRMELFPPNAEQVRNAIGMPTARPFLEYSRPAIESLLATMRNQLLKRVMDLEEQHPDLEAGVTPEQAKQVVAADAKARESGSDKGWLAQFLKDHPWVPQTVIQILEIATKALA